MTEFQKAAGYFRSGLPYNRLGHGPQSLLVLQGLLFENKPLRGLMLFSVASMYRFLHNEYTVYIVSPKPGLPNGYSMQNMGDDYAAMIEQEFGCAVDVLGTSTGGSIAQHLAADHPRLVRRLVMHSSAYTLEDAAKEAQMRVGHLASQGKWRQAFAALLC